MRRVPPPDIDTAATVEACTRRWSDLTRRRILRALLPELILWEELYQEAGSMQMLDELLGLKGLPSQVVEADVLLHAYTTRLVQSADGRVLYDRLKANSWYGRCTACGYMEVASLDHHLPKSSFPGFALSPVNLVPVCAVCNQTKGSTLPTDPRQHPVHPYFDDLGNDRWLYAAVVSSDGGPVAVFHVEPPAAWDDVLASRVECQFDALKLGGRYAAWAGLILAEESGPLAELLNALGAQEGPKAVRDQLLETAKTQRRFDPNSWKTALYYGLAESDWYVGGGMQIL